VTDTPTNTATGTSTNSPTNTSTNTATNTVTNTPTFTTTATPTNTATSAPTLGPGAVAFTAFVQNGSSEFSFVAPNGLAANQVVYFTNEGYSNTGGGLVNDSVTLSGTVTVTESIISYTAPATGLGSYVPVVISKTSNDANLLQDGTASGNLTLNGNGYGHKILAFTVNGPVTQYLAGVIFGPDTWLSGATAPVSFYDSNLPPGLDATTTTDLSAAWNSNNFVSLVSVGNDNAVLNTCENTLPNIVNPSNWAVDANIPK
jgi:hypothetical protein